MGLFDGDGRDRNRDGYVSPFDADETQAYVDPGKSLDREATQEAKQEANAKRAESAQGTSRPSSAPRHATPTSPKFAPDASRPDATPPSFSGRPSESDSTRNSDGTRTTATTKPDDDASKAQTGLSNGWATAAAIVGCVGLGISGSYGAKLALAAVTACLAIMALGRYLANRERQGAIRSIAALVIAALLLANGLTGKQRYDSLLDQYGHSSSGSASPSPSESEYPEPNFHTGEISVSGSQGRAGTFRIVSATVGPQKSFNGNRNTVIVTYSWKNTGTVNAAFGEVISQDIFQNGIGLERAYLYPEYGDQTPPAFDGKSEQTKLQPGTSKDVTIAYQMRDPNVPVEVWLSANSYDDALVASFPVQGKKPGDTVEPQQVADPMQTDGMVPDSDLEGMTKFTNYRGDVYAKILDAYRSRNDSDGSPTVTVRVAWVSRVPRPIGFTYYIDANAFVNGESLKQTYLYDKDNNPIPGYDEHSWGREDKYGVMDTVTLVYKLPSEDTKQVEMTLEGGDSEHKAQESVTLDIADKAPEQ